MDDDHTEQDDFIDDSVPNTIDALDTDDMFDVVIEGFIFPDEHANLKNFIQSNTISILEDYLSAQVQAQKVLIPCITEALAIHLLQSVHFTQAHIGLHVTNSESVQENTHAPPTIECITPSAYLLPVYATESTPQDMLSLRSISSHILIDLNTQSSQDSAFALALSELTSKLQLKAHALEADCIGYYTVQYLPDAIDINKTHLIGLGVALKWDKKKPPLR